MSDDDGGARWVDLREAESAHLKSSAGVPIAAPECQGYLRKRTFARDNDHCTIRAFEAAMREGSVGMARALGAQLLGDKLLNAVWRSIFIVQFASGTGVLHPEGISKTFLLFNGTYASYHRACKNTARVGTDMHDHALRSADVKAQTLQAVEFVARASKTEMVERAGYFYAITCDGTIPSEDASIATQQFEHYIALLPSLPLRSAWSMRVAVSMFVSGILHSTRYHTDRVAIIDGEAKALYATVILAMCGQTEGIYAIMRAAIAAHAHLQPFLEPINHIEHIHRMLHRFAPIDPEVRPAPPLLDEWSRPHVLLVTAVMLLTRQPHDALTETLLAPDSPVSTPSAEEIDAFVSERKAYINKNPKATRIINGGVRSLSLRPHEPEAGKEYSTEGVSNEIASTFRPHPNGIFFRNRIYPRLSIREVLRHGHFGVVIHDRPPAQHASASTLSEPIEVLIPRMRAGGRSAAGETPWLADEGYLWNPRPVQRSKFDVPGATTCALRFSDDYEFISAAPDFDRIHDDNLLRSVEAYAIGPFKAGSLGCFMAHEGILRLLGDVTRVVQTPYAARSNNKVREYGFLLLANPSVAVFDDSRKQVHRFRRSDYRNFAQLLEVGMAMPLMCMLLLRYALNMAGFTHDTTALLENDEGKYLWCSDTLRRSITRVGLSHTEQTNPYVPEPLRTELTWPDDSEDAKAMRALLNAPGADRAFRALAEGIVVLLEPLLAEERRFEKPQFTANVAPFIACTIRGYASSMAVVYARKALVRFRNIVADDWAPSRRSIMTHFGLDGKRSR